MSIYIYFLRTISVLTKNMALNHYFSVIATTQLYCGILPISLDLVILLWFFKSKYVILMGFSSIILCLGRILVV